MKTTPPDPGLLSLNTATVREKWSLREMIQGCARHGIRGISPWRDKLAQLGAKEAAKLARDHGLKVTGGGPQGAPGGAG
jgi:sugar phosphate isomerase/epimerase